jgi:hypothetical protein
MLSDDDKINATRWRSYFSFLRGVKSANRSLFKDFYNEMGKSKSDGGIYFIIITQLIINSPVSIMFKSPDTATFAIWHLNRSGHL